MAGFALMVLDHVAALQAPRLNQRRRVFSGFAGRSRCGLRSAKCEQVVEREEHRVSPAAPTPQDVRSQSNTAKYIPLPPDGDPRYDEPEHPRDEKAAVEYREKSSAYERAYARVLFVPGAAVAVSVLEGLPIWSLSM